MPGAVCAATLTRCRHLGFHSPVVCALLLCSRTFFRSQRVVLARRKRATTPKLVAGGEQQLVVLGFEVGGPRPRSCPTPPALRAAASSAWADWWVIVGVWVQHAVISTALAAPSLERVLDPCRSYRAEAVCRSARTVSAACCRYPLTLMSTHHVDVLFCP